MLCAVVLSVFSFAFREGIFRLMNTPPEAFDGALAYSCVCMAGLVLDMKHYGFWLGDALAGFTPFFIGFWFYFSGNWKTAVKKRKT